MARGVMRIGNKVQSTERQTYVYRKMAAGSTSTVRRYFCWCRVSNRELLQGCLARLRDYSLVMSAMGISPGTEHCASLAQPRCSC